MDLVLFKQYSSFLQNIRERTAIIENKIDKNTLIVAPLSSQIVCWPASVEKNKKIEFSNKFFGPTCADRASFVWVSVARRSSESASICAHEKDG